MWQHDPSCSGRTGTDVAAVAWNVAEYATYGNAGWVTVTSMRGEFEGRALVTPRMKPLQIQDKTVHQIGVPMHWSYMGVTKGDTPNDLTHLVLEPNVSIYEVKAITCNVRAGRRSRKTRETTRALEMQSRALERGSDA